jgi:two-component system response regulator AtoC
VNTTALHQDPFWPSTLVEVRPANDDALAPAATSGVLGDSTPMREVMECVRRVAPSHATVLLLGESGTGKELVARAIHESSLRKEKPFVKLNCGALPDALLESELFGYEPGAFSGATRRKLGRIETAHGGTLFLDEIGDITPAMQVKLLRVLQEREIERLGGNSTIKVDVRILAATHRNLPELVAEGRFREDLYYRLNVVPIHLPPLRARATDIAPLARRFAAEHAQANGKRIELRANALERLSLERWPGNVRQLQNFVERLVVLCDGPMIGIQDVERELARAYPAGLDPMSEGTDIGSLDATRRSVECVAIRSALDRAHGNRTMAARILGLSRRGLYYKLEEHGLA